MRSRRGLSMTSSLNRCRSLALISLLVAACAGNESRNSSGEATLEFSGRILIAYDPAESQEAWRFRLSNQSQQALQVPTEGVFARIEGACTGFFHPRAEKLERESEAGEWEPPPPNIDLLSAPEMVLVGPGDHLELLILPWEPGSDALEGTGRYRLSVVDLQGRTYISPPFAPNEGSAAALLSDGFCK